MKTKRIISAIMCVSMLILSGCGNKNSTPSAELPPDDVCGRRILETDSGYYYNTVNPILSLRYHEKSTGADIFLCAKPECMHNGSKTCTATYDFMVCSAPILYDGAIYFTADISTKESRGCALYKASLDGSSLDKIGDIAVVKTQSDNSFIGGMPEFIIHKGYAYIYYLLGDNSYGEFIQSGLVKMDIKSGEKKDIITDNDFFSARHISVYQGAGDYVYYLAWSSGCDDKDRGYFRYDINTDTYEKLLPDMDLNKLGFAFATSDTIYIDEYIDDNNVIIHGFDAAAFEPKGNELNIGGRFHDMMVNDGYIFVYDGQLVKIWKESGEKVSELDVPAVKDGFVDSSLYGISDGKLYFYIHDMGADSVMYFCPLDDAFSGNAHWDEAYTKKYYEEYWDEYPISTKLQMMSE